MARLSPVEAYRLWASSWDSAASPIVELERRYLLSWLQELRGKTFADVGCGTGRWMSHAVHAGAAAAIGIDLSLEMLQQAAFKPGLRGRLAVGDMAALPLPDGFADVVLCALSLGHCRDAGRCLAGLLRLATAGGRVIISDFHPAAIRSGWKRTFQCGEETLEVESYPYEVEALLAQAHESGYSLEQLLELTFGPEEEKIFVDAGRADLFARVENLPAVLLLSLRRL
jgi:ubiquinone/menaquinone biosynthesis C-methylase UbiE